MRWCSKEENRHLGLSDYGGNIMLFDLRDNNYVSYYLDVRGGTPLHTIICLKWVTAVLLKEMCWKTLCIFLILYVQVGWMLLSRVTSIRPGTVLEMCPSSIKSPWIVEPIRRGELVPSTCSLHDTILQSYYTAGVGEVTSNYCSSN